MPFVYTGRMQRDDLKALQMPDNPGVYIFRSSRGKPLYVGKATSLRDRVRSYFAADIAAVRSSAIAQMVEESTTLTWEETDSVLEALILESNLIKKYSPRFNTLEKDNKSYNYLIMTKEAFPHLRVVRGRELFQKYPASSIYKTFGPYPQGTSLKEALKIVRKIFPYADACTSGKGRPCFNRQLGLCPGVCSGEITKQEYARTIKNISLIFSGKMRALKAELEKEMEAFVKKEKFEEAGIIKRQLSALKHIRDVSLIKDEYRVAPGGELRRIEAYDVAHTSGTETVGVMTVVLMGEPQKAEYRKFKINTVTNDDPAALTEMLSRRLTHNEWPMPRVIVVDGGALQLHAAESVLAKAGVSIPIVGVVKDDHHKAHHLIGDTKAISMHEKEILLANAEAHRFAITWHRSRRRKGML